MKISQLTETVVWTDIPSVMTDGEEMIPVYRLQTPNDLTSVLHQSKEKVLRGLVRDDLVLGWDAYHDVHGGVIDWMEQNDRDAKFSGYTDHEPTTRDWKALVYFYPQGVAMAPKRAGDPQYVLAHPIIQKLYRGNPQLVRADRA